ncbi:MAG TPA: DNA polymerase I [Thermomicrobiales bacterium]|jgi:DNA polymerase-1|nr:DNA polymerase I [Thermomicrobiales bacterium]
MARPERQLQLDLGAPPETAPAPEPPTTPAQENSAEPEPAGQEAESLVLIDGHGLAYRAFHAMNAQLTTASGEPTNAVFSFTLMLLEVLRRYRPDQMVMTFDTGRTFRHDLSADYKATRASMPDELRVQMSRIRQLVEAFNIPIREVRGFEADDVIGTLAGKGHDAGYAVTIVTGDSDLLQLAADGIEVVTPGANNSFSDLRTYDVAAVRERYGFDPPLVADYKALVGDTSDNIAGVPGIGDKTAKTLLAQYGPIEQMRDHLDEIKPPKARKALTEHFNEALAAKRLTTIRKDAPVELDLGPHEGQYDRNRVLDLFRELEFRRLVSQVPYAWNGPEQPAAPAKEPPVEYTSTPVTNEETLAALAAELRQGQPSAVDVESTSTDPIQAALVGIAIATSPNRSYYVPVAHQEGEQVPLARVRAVLGPLLADERLPKYTHHGKYDLLVLQNAGIELRGVTFDTMIAAYLLGETTVGLKELAFTRLGFEMTPIEDLIGRGKAQITMDAVEIQRAADYAGADVHATYRLVAPFAEGLAERDLERVFRELELPLVPVLADMERTGITLDAGYLHGLSGKIGEIITQREQEIHQLAGHPFNINSTQQLAKVLFEELGLPGRRRTQTGYSTNVDVLEELRDKHEIVAAVLEYRQLVKLKSTYIDALPTMVNPKTGRIHTSFNQTIASTGRLSSVNPNLQNIPIRTEIGREVRRAFIADNTSPHRLFPDEEAVLVGADYSQVELRLLAHLSGDENLIAAFQRGEDIHRRTAALVYNIPQDQVTADQRRIAKSANFGIIYGLSAYGLSRDTGMPVAQASRFIETYFQQYPKVRAYLDSSRDYAIRENYVASISGRRRYIPDIHSTNPTKRAAAERMAINMPVQGTAADLMKEAMLRLHAALVDEGLLSKMLLQVHDELIFEAPRSEVDALYALARRIMVGVGDDVHLAVPLDVEVKSGMNWGDMEEQ